MQEKYILLKSVFLLFSYISFYYYYSIKSKTQGQKLLFIIEKYIKVKVIKFFPNKYYKTFTKKLSIVPPIYIVEKINKKTIDNINKINTNNSD